MDPNLYDVNEKIVKTSISSEGTVRQAMEAIDRGAMGVAILYEPRSGRFLGLVTDGDIRRALLAGKGLDTPVMEVANRKPVTVSVQDAPAQALGLLSERSRFVPVLDKSDRVVDLVYFDKRSHLPLVDPIFWGNEITYVNECILTGWVSSAGKFVTQFEESFAAFCEARYAVAVCNGTCALHLALLAMDIGPGSEVIVPTLSFIASANAVTYTGARPVFADSEPRTWNLDGEKIEKLITPKTRAIMPVHLYGHPVDMDKITEIARRHKLAVIEDAAEAHGALCRGKKVGALGDIGCFSFYGNKIITTGEGGMIVTNRKDLADRMRMLRDHGMSREHRYVHPVLGYNYRLTNIQAALGVAQMERIEAILTQKRQVASAYAAALQNIKGISTTAEEKWARSVFWLNNIFVDEGQFGMNRDQLMQFLGKRSIDTRPLFPPIHQQPIYNTGEHLPIAEEASRRGLSLPSAVNLTLAEVERIAATIREAGALR
jgi:perosamine synthetase